MPRDGFTLIELVVVLVVLGVSLVVVSLGADAFAREAPHSADHIDEVRRAALASGRDTTVIILREGSAVLVTLLRDGRVIEDTVLSRVSSVER